MASTTSSSADRDDFFRHEPLFRAIGLYDFACLPLDLPLRSDLVSLLASHYDPVSHLSLVRGSAISLTRDDLAVALALPLNPEPVEFDAEIFSDAEPVETIVRFIVERMLLRSEEEVGVMQAEEEAAVRLVKEGKAHLVDWAGVMWALVERDLLEASRSGRCCSYGLHLQCLMKCQRPELFEDSGKIRDAASSMQRCSVRVAVGVDCEDVDKERRDGPAARLCSSEELNSVEFLDMVSGDASCSPLVQPLEPTSGESLHMSIDTCKISANNDSNSLFLTLNSCKGEMVKINDEDDDNQKCMPNFGSSDHEASDFDTCVEQVQSWMRKSKMMCVERNREYRNTQAKIWHVKELMQKKDHIIQSLEKARVAELEKRQLQTCRLKNELRVMSSLVYGYRKALKDTKSAFAEYRKYFPEDHNSLGKDVSGTSGLILSNVELEKQHLMEKLGLHFLAAELINKFQKDWCLKFAECAEWFTNMARKLVELNREVEILWRRLEDPVAMTE
ncbi:uncharacterized protein [Typha angustifolia]|uniref:uncharacterized protein n=1 Tax=Typha angustifolia TaxID=59011 RepID=UPI003C3011CE